MGKGSLPPDSTEYLVQRAKAGDREALHQLVNRNYQNWLRRYHRKLGTALHRMYDTEDLVQSALGEALLELPRLRNEAAFFSWVTSIIRHKIARKHRELGRRRSISLETPDHVSPSRGPRRRYAENQTSALETYVHTLEVILGLFPAYPEEMAAVTMKHIEGLTLEQMVARLKKSPRTVQRWIKEGTSILKVHLSPGDDEQ